MSNNFGRISVEANPDSTNATVTVVGLRIGQRYRLVLARITNGEDKKLSACDFGVGVASYGEDR